MRAYTLTDVSDAVLLRDLAALVAQDRTTTAALLAHIAEVDARRLYLPAAYPSMHAYCVDELRLSEDAAYKRIQAARAARKFPVLFTALADGRLHLAAVCLLAPHLTPENAEELVALAAYRRKSEIEPWLAQRFPGPEGPEVPAVPARVEALLARAPDPQLAPGQVAPHAPEGAGALAPGQADAPAPPPGGAPLAVERFVLEFTIGPGTHDKLRYAQALLSHAVPSGDVAQVLDRALDALIGQLEKRKFGATARPRPRPRPQSRPGSTPRLRHGSTPRRRTVPAHVRRAVWQRDQGQCTFLSPRGHRCAARKFLEFDHVDPVARGGQATVERMRLRCRAHNQYEAECAFGAGFMKAKRDAARPQTAAARARTGTGIGTAEARAGLRALGSRAEEARQAVEFSETLQDATLEERLRAALKFLGQRRFKARVGTPVEVSPRPAAGLCFSSAT